MTVKQFAAKYGKTPRTISRWVKSFDETLSSSVNFNVAENEDLFMFLLEKAGVGADDQKPTFEQGGIINPLFTESSLINKGFQALRSQMEEMSGDYITPDEGGEHITFPHQFPDQEPDIQRYNPKFFNPDGSPKSKRKVDVAQSVPQSRKEDIIDRIYTNKDMMAAFLAIPILECIVVFYEGTFSVFGNQIAAVLFAIVGAFVGYGMTSAALHYEKKDDRIKVEIGFGVLQIGLLLSILLSVPYLSEIMMVLTSVIVFVTARHAIVSR